MSAEEDEQLGLESTQLISDITIEIMTIKEDLQLLHIHDHNNSHSCTFSSLPKQLQDDSSKDVSKNVPSFECKSAKEEDDEEHKLVYAVQLKQSFTYFNQIEMLISIDQFVSGLLEFYPMFQSDPAKQKLVSALKGSREKEGNSAKGKELSVTWAPEVYDPVPSAAQTYIKIKKLRPKKKKNHEDYKKNGKYKQRGKVDKGGSSSKSKNKSMKPMNQKQGGDDDRMWWQPIDEIYDD